MSVLNDVNVTTGAAVRLMASGISASRAKEFITLCKEWDCMRMDGITYETNRNLIGEQVLSVCSQYWAVGTDRVAWGLPSGSWEDFCDRILADEELWDCHGFNPPVDREVYDWQAKDRLLVGYCFPFLAEDRYEDPCVTHVMMPMLAEATRKSWEIQFGSSAVIALVSGVNKEDAWGDIVTQAFVPDAPGNRFKEFNFWMTSMEVATSTNTHDWFEAGVRAQAVDWDRVVHGSRFLSLSEMCNYCYYLMNQYRYKSKKQKALKRAVEDIEDLKRRAVRAPAPARSHYARVAASDAEDLYSANGPNCYRKGPAGYLQFYATGNLVAIVREGHVVVLTREDLKSLKFAAMSHSMWHVHAATIDMEYEASTAIHEETEFDKLTASAAGQMKALLDDVMKQFNVQPAVQQQVVDLPTVKRGINRIWALYTEVLDLANSYRRSDYVGRYLHELFSVYTAELAGELMQKGYEAARAEVINEFAEMGFPVARHMAEMSAVFSTLPLSVIQDFGRLSKIATAYDVNPVYSYLDRCKKMAQPNPRGHATMDGEFSCKTVDMTEDELDKSDDKLRSAVRVLLALGNIRAGILSTLSDAEFENFKDDPFPAIVNRLKSEGMRVVCQAKLRREADLYVPKDDRAIAHSQAKELIDSGVMPTNPYAGAYLNVTGMLAYAKRETNDLAILKPTALPDQDYYVVLSNLSRLNRMTPTRDTDGRRDNFAGTMITDYLLGRFPSRREALAYVANNRPIASTSDKVETNKYPPKTRLITALCGAARRLQGEFESNNGKVCVHVPGYMIGRNPGDMMRSIYAALRADVKPNKVRLYGSLDLSSFSTGMHWRVQTATNDVLFDAYGAEDGLQKAIEGCTKGSMMIRADGAVRLAMVNDIGANYEGIDGKRNTLMHCAMWYIARCKAYSLGITESMRAFLYIDDGAFSLDVEKDKLHEQVTIMRESLTTTYTEYGLKISMLKTVISTSYMQFLNELYLHGVHVAYGFRALCHTAAQEFPPVGTVREEIAVITGGIKGSAVAGGHPLRLLVGYHFILYAYFRGVIGNKGKVFAGMQGHSAAILLHIPTISGGFGLPSWTALFTNLAGNRDVEKLDKLRQLGYFFRHNYPAIWPELRAYILANTIQETHKPAGGVVDRVTVAHAGTARFGDLGRDLLVARAALDHTTHLPARTLLTKYVTTRGKPASDSFPAYIASQVKTSPVTLPITVVEKALGADPGTAVVRMVGKITSSYLIGRFLPSSEIRRLNSAYRREAQKIIKLFQSTIL